MPVEQLHLFQLVCLVHKFVYNRSKLPGALTTFLHLTHDYYTRNRDMLHLMPIKTTSGNRMVRFKASLEWNNLPQLTLVV